MKSEWDKMVAGELYLSDDPELKAARLRARLLLKRYNDSNPDDQALRRELLAELIGSSGPGLYMEPPFYCDYGTNIHTGSNVYCNFDCVILDVAPVTIGDATMFGPAVQIYTATHPMDWETRSSGRELGYAIAIGDHVWVGGGAIILPGVKIGSRSIIGAGSVVTRDIPDDVFAAGNPCRVIRSLLEKKDGV